MSSHLVRRAPRKGTGFSWGRFPLDDGEIVSYRLFRRDHRGALHMAILDFRGESRSEIAQRVRRQRHALRNKVDEIDLQQWDLAA